MHGTVFPARRMAEIALAETDHVVCVRAVRQQPYQQDTGQRAQSDLARVFLVQAPLFFGRGPQRRGVQCQALRISALI